MKNKGLPPVEVDVPMPPVNPPKGGSGVPNKKSEKRKDLYAKAKLIDALSNTLERNLRKGHSLRDREVDRVAREKLIDVINSLRV